MAACLDLGGKSERIKEGCWVWRGAKQIADKEQQGEPQIQGKKVAEIRAQSQQCPGTL